MVLAVPGRPRCRELDTAPPAPAANEEDADDEYDQEDKEAEEEEAVCHGPCCSMGRSAFKDMHLYNASGVK